ncbi:MAG TPA: PepSY domain-containing protein [Candidatus Fournierella merdigallinarum]|nr:PepSY domain-containing protein [Candidatus Fournierella merdigallinarum]
MANTISQQEHERHKRRRARQWLGLAICLLVLIGAFTVISAAVGGVAILFDDTDEKLEYEQRLQALVMLDPLPFDDLDQADPALLKEAAIWAAVSTAQSSATGLDAYERDPNTDSLLLPAVEVDAAAASLLGADYKLTHETFGTVSGDMTFEYDEEKQCYLIPVTGQVGMYTPKVEKLTKKSGRLYVTVGYVPAPGLSGDFSLTAPTEPTKYMDYAFEKVDGVYYLRALAVSEMKPSSSAAANAPETDLDYEDYFDPTSVIAGNADSLPGEDTSSPASDSAQEDTSAADSAGDEATSDAGEE